MKRFDITQWDHTSLHCTSQTGQRDRCRPHFCGTKGAQDPFCRPSFGQFHPPLPGPSTSRRTPPFSHCINLTAGGTIPRHDL